MIMSLNYFFSFVTARINQGNVWQSELKYTNTIKYPDFPRQGKKVLISERWLN